MTDHNLTDQSAEQAALREAQEQACAEQLFQSFDWKNRISEVTEHLSMEPDTLDSALVAFIRMDSLTLRLALEKVAMELCEYQAKMLVSAHGGDWALFLDEVA